MTVAGNPSTSSRNPDDAGARARSDAVDTASMPVLDLIKSLDGWKPRKVVVVGDFMLDRYVYGDADRLSPDAPVPVLATKRDEAMPGGAGSVSRALAALRCKVSCVGVVGRDEAGQSLKQLLRDAGCSVGGLLTDATRPTTVKQSLIGLAQHRHPQKMFRVDTEHRQPVHAELEDRLFARAQSALRGAKVLCIEDYGKGVLTPSLCQRLIAAAREQGVPVLVDPASKADYVNKYRGASCITPNRSEAAIAMSRLRRDSDPPHAAPAKGNANAGSGKRTAPSRDGDSDAGAGEVDPAQTASTLLSACDLQAIVITLDREGALLLERGKSAQAVPTRARAVYDVTGAGDVVLATLAASIANGAGWLEAAQLANVAAGIAVERFGLSTVPLEDVLLELWRHQGEQDITLGVSNGNGNGGSSSRGKLRTLSQLVPEIAAHRTRGKRIAFTNGCFDILHAGHVCFLRQARAHGELLVVGLNSDASIRRIKGDGRPVNHEPDRVMVLSELQSVDYIVLFDQDTPMKVLEAIQPDVLVKGGDYTRDGVVGGDYVESYGGEVALVDLVQGRSTTNIIERVRGE